MCLFVCLTWSFLLVWLVLIVWLLKVAVVCFCYDDFGCCLIYCVTCVSMRRCTFGLCIWFWGDIHSGLLDWVVGGGLL